LDAGPVHVFRVPMGSVADRPGQTRWRLSDASRRMEYVDGALCISHDIILRQRRPGRGSRRKRNPSRQNRNMAAGILLAMTVCDRHDDTL
jgi:hypothetical protein